MWESLLTLFRVSFIALRCWIHWRQLLNAEAPIRTFSCSWSSAHSKALVRAKKIFMVKNNHIWRLRVAGNWIQNMPLVSYTASCIIWMTAKQVLPFSCIILQTASTEEQIVALCLHKSILLLFLLVHLIHNCQSSTIWSSITCVCVMTSYLSEFS